jgi:superfamily II DNA or RNA helicase
MAFPELRKWQSEALALWSENRQQGIVEAVTGGGKTVLALAAVAKASADTTLIVVPTVALLDQWWVEAASFFELSLDDINIVRSRRSVRAGTINIAVLNTAAKIEPGGRPVLLVVDECHKAASAQFRSVLEVNKSGSLGLSATPERPYDTGLDDVLVPALGPILFRYTYREAMRDGVIVPFVLHNIVFELEEESQKEYDKLTKGIARSLNKLGPEAPETIALMLRRARVLNMSLTRVRLTLRLVARHRGQRILVFHENIDACNLIHAVLTESGVSAGVYHSRLRTRERADMLAAFRRGRIDVLVTCRALDEGFNVPETEVGIIAASTATRRQRIQRLGRVLRPTKGKHAATVYTLVATAPEVERLKAEEQDLEGVAETVWSRA